MSNMPATAFSHLCKVSMIYNERSADTLAKGKNMLDYLILV